MHEQQEKENYYVAAVFLAIALTAIVTMAACGQVTSNKWDIVTGVSTALYTTITAFILYVAAKQFKLYNDVAAADFALNVRHGYTLKEIADFLSIHYTTVSKVIHTFEETN